jgi:hypothetical protein
MSGKHLTRRDLIKRFGFAAFVLTPVARAMGYVAGGSFVNAPRFVMFFKGGSFHSPSVNPATINDLGSTPLAPLAPLSQDLILFKNMSIHGGSPKTDGYKEEHAAGLIGCTTGNSYHYSKNDSYYAYTDFESIDITIANHYKAVAATAALPFSSLHVGGGAHSDADNVGLGQRYISYRARQAGDDLYGNAIEPIQDAGQVYDMLMQRVNLLCASGGTGGGTGTPPVDNTKLRQALLRKKSLIDFSLGDIADAKRVLGMDSAHAQKLDGMVAGWREVEKATTSQLAALDAGTGTPTTPGTKLACPTGARPTGNGTKKQNLDQLSPVHDQMIGLVKLAFEWDLTRVVAFTLSGASSGQTLPSRGVSKAHHSLEHGNDIAALNTIDPYYAEKFASLMTALKGIDDGDGHTALYNSSLILGMECWSNSSSGHYLTNIPFVLAGQGAGKFQTGRIVDAQKRNNNDLLISVQNASGIASNTYGLASLCKGPIV